MLFNEPRNWKWMVPFGLLNLTIYAFVWVTYKWAAATPDKQQDWMLLGILVAGFGFIFLVATLMNAWIYFESHRADIYASIQAAQNSTPEVRMFEAAKGMHPDAVHELLAHRRLLWRIKYVAVGKLVDWVLDDAPSVHAGFVDFVLDYSSEVSVMPKSMLSDGSKQFDPEGIMTDYEQYDSLILLMQHKLICTQAFGNQPPKWIQPWTPELVRHRFGLDEGVYQAEGGEMIKAIERARETVASPTADPLRTIKSKIQQDALDGLEQTKEMRRKFELNQKMKGA